MRADGIETMRNEQKTWQLLAPDWSKLDTIWQNPLPFVLWPIGSQPLLAHWLDEAVRRGFEEVELYVADRATEVKAFLRDTPYWPKKLKVISLRREADAPATAERMDGLPVGELCASLPCEPGELLSYWLELRNAWLAGRSPDEVTLETFHPAGGWVGPHAKIHRSVRLRAPFWIGARAEIGANCEIGPNAFVGEHSILDENVEVVQACVLPDTYLGKNTRLFQSAAAGGTLIDFRRGCRVEIAERFILGPVGESVMRKGLRTMMSRMLG